MFANKEKVIVREVGLRDGLQSIDKIVPTPTKLEWLAAAYNAGLREIEVGSFVPARLLPQMADTAAVVKAARNFEDLVVSVLIPNLKGAELALDAGAHLMLIPLSASHQHSLANLRKTPDEVVRETARIRSLRDASGSSCLIEAGISTAFGCTLQGRVEPDEVLRLAQAMLDAGADRVSLADTVGYAGPSDVYTLFGRIHHVVGERLAGAHFHDTRGLGLANTVAALQAGVRRFDSCLAGIGGCPHAPGASGNVSTEDLAFMLQTMQFDTGLDVERLLSLRARIADHLHDVPLHGALWRAGLPSTALTA